MLKTRSACLQRSRALVHMRRKAKSSLQAQDDAYQAIARKVIKLISTEDQIRNQPVRRDCTDSGWFTVKD